MDASLVVCAYIVLMDNACAADRKRLNPSRNRGRETEAMAAELALRWQDENRAFLDGHNAKVEADGLLLAEYRRF